MLLRKIRLSGLFVTGFVIAIVALLWMYFFDVSVKTEVKWLYVGLCFGVMSGVLGALGGHFSNDEDKLTSSILIGVAIVLDIVFTVFLFICQNDATVLASAKNSGSVPLFKAINLIAIIVSIVSSVGFAGGLGLDIYAKYLSKQDDKIIAEHEKENLQ